MDAALRCRSVSCQGVALVAAALVLPCPAFAQDRPSSVGVLRATDAQIAPAVVDAVDHALLRDLKTLAGIHAPIVSPVEYEDLQFAVGCQNDSRECLSSMAQTLKVEAIVLRRLRKNEAGLATLELVYFDGAASTDDVARTVARNGEEHELETAVPDLVRELFQLAAPAAEPAAPPSTAPPPSGTTPVTVLPTPRRESPRETGVGVSTLTWVMLATGTAVFAAGAVVGLTANQSFSDLEKRSVRTEDDAARLHSDFDAIEQRATVANVLMPVGGVALGVGIVLLTLDLTSAPGSGDGVALRVSPSTEGAALSLHGALPWK